jgi:hypothetical protein
MKYAISYIVNNKRHVRYYAALNPQTALEMFKQTRAHGGLQAYAVSDIEVSPIASEEKNKT